MFYVTAYEIGLAYGGPEEGGWFYQYGIPQDHPGNRVYKSRAAAHKYSERFQAQLNQQNREEGRRPIDQTPAADDFLSAQVDEGLPAPYPQQRPRYE